MIQFIGQIKKRFLGDFDTCNSAEQFVFNAWTFMRLHSVTLAPQQPTERFIISSARLVQSALRKW